MSEAEADVRDDRPPRPTAAQFFAIARRPKWIAALVLVLAIAGAFAALGQWQLERSITSPDAEMPATETPVPLETIAQPFAPMRDAAIGQRVTVTAELVEGDWSVLTGRDNDGPLGAWLVGHARTDAGDSLAVALGWAPDAAAAEAAIAGIPAGEPLELAGRYLPSESPEVNDVEEGERRAMSAAELVNLWAEPGTPYAGYLVLAEPLGGLDAIHSPPPLRGGDINWLNLFYALEWVIFAGFAIYLWYRLVRDEFEREIEEAAEAAAAGERSGSVP